MPYERTISCSDCDFKQQDFCCCGLFVYLEGSREYTVDRVTAFCIECEKFTAVESLEAPPFVLKAEQELKADLAKKMEEYAALRASKIFVRLFGNKKLQADIDWLTNTIPKKAVEAQEYRAFYERIRARAPRCLECGSSDFVPLHVERTMATKNNIYPNSDVEVLSPKHPGCGGTFTRSYTGTHCALVTFKSAYDTKGTFLHKDWVDE